MKKFLKTFAETGICELRTSKVIKEWKDNFRISKHSNGYEFVIMGKGARWSKVAISEPQALEIIQELKLIEVKSSLFRISSRFISESELMNDIEKTEKRVKEIEKEYEFMASELASLKGSLTTKQ